MGRLQKRLARQASPYWPGGTSPTSFLEPASPEAQTPGSATESSPQGHSSFFILWPSRSTSTLRQPGPDATNYHQSRRQANRIPPDELLSVARSPRFPRHVPI